MVKSVMGARLLRSLVRSGKAQRRSVAKLVSHLFEVPKPAPIARPKRQAKAQAKPRLDVKRKVITTAMPDIPRSARVHSEVAPGKWLASHYVSAPAIGVPARRMRYWLYLPCQVASAAEPQRMPLIVMLHGCHQTATQFAQGTRMNQLAEHKGYAVLYPQQLVSTQAQRCWKWYDRATQEGGGDVGMIVGIIEQVAAQYAIDRSRIYISGMSAGAGMAHIVALNHPELIAALGLHSGPMYGAGHGTLSALGVMRHGAAQRVDSAIEEVLLRRPQFPSMPTVLIQGQEDQVVRPVNQLQLTQQGMLLNRLAAGTPSKVTRKAGRAGSSHGQEIHDFYVGRKLLLRVVRIAQLGHAWSGGDADFAFNAGTGPDASKLMLDFFARHRR